MQDPISEPAYLPNLEAYMDRASALELARRSLLGAPVYTFISLIILAGTPILVDYGSLAATEAVLLIMLGGIRVWFALGFEHRYDAIGEKAVSQFSMLTALQSLTLGFLSAMVILQYWATQQTILTIVLSAGCVAAGTSALSVRRGAQFIFLACVLAPFGIAVYLVAGLAQATLITGFLSLMAFLVQDGGSAKRVYFQRLREHYGDEIARRRAAYVKFTIQAELDPSHNVLELAEAKPAKNKIKSVAPQSAHSGDIARLYPKHILVVDDDDILRQITCTRLKKLGYVADEVANGEDAIAAVMYGAYDLVFMDLHMPGMNGIESSRWIRECSNGGGELRIIALTGDDSDEAREECSRVGMDDFLTKPVLVKDLEAILGHNRHESNRQARKQPTTTAQLRSVH